MFSLAQLHAIYTVYKDLDKNKRTVKCATCGKTLNINSFEDCYNIYGHYIDRSLQPEIKYHYLNAYPQCPSCNTNTTSDIKNKFDDYIKYRFNVSNINEFKKELISDKRFNDYNFAYNFYIKELLNLYKDFPELYEVILDVDTGAIVETKYESEIEEQWDTFSKSYKQDLDTLVKLLNMENIEYERF